MKELKTLLFIILIINPLTLVSQSIENFVLTSDKPKLEGQFYVGNYNSTSPAEAKYKFLKWLTYYNAGEDLYIESTGTTEIEIESNATDRIAIIDQESEDNKITFTRIFPQGINMRVLKGVQYDLLGNVDLAVRFVVEFKDSRYRVLIDRLGYFDNELDSNSYIMAGGTFKDYTPFFNEEEMARSYTSYQNVKNLPLEYRSPEELKKTEKRKLDDFIVLLNSFLRSTGEFENDFYDQPKIVDNSFSINENNASFPGQSIRKDLETVDREELLVKTINWFGNNSEELGLQKLYTYNDKVFIVAKRYFNSSSGLFSTMEAMTGVSFGEVHYYYIEIKLNNDSVDFGINKILWARFTSGCGSGLDKALIKTDQHEFIVDKKIYIPSDYNTSDFGGLKQFNICPAILMYNEVTNLSDLFNKRGKPRKARTKTADDQLAFYNDIYQNFNRNVFPSETVEEDW